MQVARAGGEIYEVRYNPAAATIRVRLAVPGPLLDLGGLYSTDDSTRHSVCLLASGDVKKVFFNI